MRPSSGGGRFESVCDRLRLPDDVTMGFVAERLVGAPLTVVEEFHSHLEPQKMLLKGDWEEQISFSYSENGSEEDRNVVEMPEGSAAFDEEQDPTRYAYVFD